MPKLSLGDFQSNRTVHLVTLVLVSAVVALGLHLTYLPWWCGDSSMYARPAWQIYHGTFAGYPGYRTPGYPLFLLACEGFRPADKTLMTPLSGEIVTWAQSLLHLAMAPLIYFSMERLLIRPWINFSLALLFALLVGVAQFQMYLLSESLCCFCLVLATCLATVAIDRFRHEQPSAIVALLAGFAFGAAVLVRPNIIFPWIFFIGAVPAFALWRKMRRRPIEIARMMLQVSRPCFAGGALLIIGWLFVNYENTGLITLSTMIDVTRVSTAYNLFDRVHPEDKVLGDIMVKYHLQTEHDDLQKKIYFFSALPEIRAHASQMPLPDAATGASALHTVQYLGHVSRYLLWENPGVWAQKQRARFQPDLRLSLSPDRAGRVDRSRFSSPHPRRYQRHGLANFLHPQ